MAETSKTAVVQGNFVALKKKLSSPSVREAFAFYLYTAPWLIGFLGFTAGPFIASFVLSLSKWDMTGTPIFIGLQNYAKIFGQDHLFRKALYNTAYFVAFNVPLHQMICLGLALLLNQKLRGIAVYRTIFYLPSVTAGVATAYLWAYLFSVNNGLFNATLAMIGVQGPRWFLDPHWSKPALIIMSLWGGGSTMIIYLAGLQGIPIHLYEAAEVDGANVLDKFWHVTIPMLTPTIFYNVVMGFIGAFNVFTSAFVITEGGPVNSTLFYMLYLYRQAFYDFSMGYASALAWVLFLIVMALTVIQLLTSRRWVYYEYRQQGKGLI